MHKKQTTGNVQLPVGCCSCGFTFAVLFSPNTKRVFETTNIFLKMTQKQDLP